MVTSRHGQAFIELAVGMFVLTLVLSALFAFASIIIHSLDTQRTLRGEAGKASLLGGGSDAFASASATDTVEVEPFAADYIFGSDTIEIKQSVHMPRSVICD